MPALLCYEERSCEVRQHSRNISLLEVLGKAHDVLLNVQEFVTTRPGDKEPVCGRQEYSVTEDRPIEKVQTLLLLAAEALSHSQ